MQLSNEPAQPLGATRVGVSTEHAHQLDEAAIAPLLRYPTGDRRQRAHHGRTACGERFEHRQRQPFEQRRQDENVANLQQQRYRVRRLRAVGTVPQQRHADLRDPQVIGRGGRTHNALRTVLKAAAVKQGRRVFVDIVD